MVSAGRGARVNYVRLPAVQREKVGLDDHLVNNDAESLECLLAQARPTVDWVLGDARGLSGGDQIRLLKRVFRYLAVLGPLEANSYREQFKALGVDGNTFRQEIAVARKQLEAAEVRRSQHQGTAVAEERQGDELGAQERARLFDLAEPLLRDPALLHMAGRAIQDLGVAGEDTNIRIVFLALTSGARNNPISLAVKGESSVGKNFVVQQTLKLFPKSDYILLTGMSKQALVYSQESFKHKTIVIFEQPGMGQADYNIRTLQSEHQIVFQTVVKDPETGMLKTVQVEKEGPTNFIVTTTDPQLHSENETRNWSILVDESEEQTAAVKEKNAQLYELLDSEELPAEELERWHAVRNALEPVRVVIPYAIWLARHTPNAPLRIRRDLPKLLNLIEVIAYLHQYQRSREFTDRGIVITAGIEDYFMARCLVENVFGYSLQGSQQKTAALVEAVRRVYEHNPSADGDDVSVSLGDLAVEVKRSKSTISRWLKPAIDAGFVEVVRETNRGVEGVKPGHGMPDVPDALPSVEALADAYPALARSFGAIHPLTGEQVALTEERVGVGV